MSSRWTDTYDELSALDRRSPLSPADLDRLALAAYLTGRDRESVDLFSRAHNALLAADDCPGAARAAYWAASILMHTGERARASGWLARAQRLLDERGSDCAIRGYLMLPLALQQIGSGDLGAAEGTFAEAARVGDRFHERDLIALARAGHGRVLVARGEVARGVALLDEVMVSVTSGELSPLASGTVYCVVISCCFEMLDMRRAQEWTDALNHWCAAQPDMVPYRGECLVDRVEIMLLHGHWGEAVQEARRACELSGIAPRPVVAAAFYQLAEAHRLRGEFEEAEEAYRVAAEWGRNPQPGLALLRLAQGRTDAAKAAITHVLDDARDPRTRSRMLPAAVEILLAAGDVAAARHAADQLGALAGALDTPMIRAISAHAAGAVLLAGGEARRALGPLRQACGIWRDLDAPYEAARTTILIALACRDLGDHDSAEMELIAAARAFRELGAAPDTVRAAEVGRRSPAGSGQLTARELEVLRLVASGKSNRSIADELRISEKTVARHMSNIFTKLDLPSRAAATAYAFRHNLV